MTRKPYEAAAQKTSLARSGRCRSAGHGGNALKIPEMEATELPPDPGSLLDHPYPLIADQLAVQSAGADSVPAAGRADKDGTLRASDILAMDDARGKRALASTTSPRPRLTSTADPRLEFNSSTVVPGRRDRSTTFRITSSRRESHLRRAQS